MSSSSTTLASSSFVKENFATPIPIIDLDLSNKSKVASEILNAMKEYGFFYLQNHGVEQELIDNVMNQSKKFFSLPLDKKMTCLANEINRGYTPMREETLDPSNQKIGDTKEGYYIGRDIPLSDPDCQRLPLHGPNIWPDEEALNIPGWREIMEIYYEKMKNLGLQVTQLICIALNMDEHALDANFTKAQNAIRLLHYEDTISNPIDGIFGCGAHSDYGMLTFLHTDDVGGLQLYLKEQWVDAAPVPGCFIVNLGDMLQRWTNDDLKSTIHRVVNSSGKERYSVPFFFEPNFESLVECLPVFCSEENPAKYPSIKSGDYLLEKYNMTHSNFNSKEH